MHLRIDEYKDFVWALASNETKNFDTFIERLEELEDAGLNVHTIGHATDGLCAESGELKEIFKKILYQGKPWDEKNRYHAKRELSDIYFYFVLACRALGYHPDDIMHENVSKLKARFPDGEFDAYYSENRQKEDL